MPTYEYACAQCAATFDVRASIREKEKGLKPKCPTCGSKTVVRVFGNVAVLTGGKASSTPCCPGAGPSCCPGPRE